MKQNDPVLRRARERSRERLQDLLRIKTLKNFTKKEMWIYVGHHYGVWNFIWFMLAQTVKDFVKSRRLLWRYRNEPKVLEEELDAEIAKIERALREYKKEE